MKNTFILLALAAAAAGLHSCAKADAAREPLAVTWEAHNMPLDSTGVQHYRQIYTVTGDFSDVERLCFNQFARPMQLTDERDTLIEIVPSYYAIATPRFAEAAAGDTLVFEIITRGTMGAICYGPDGMHTVLSDGSTQAADLTRIPLSMSRDSYATERLDRMPSAEDIYAENEALAAGRKDIYDVIPSFKSVTLTGGESRLNPADAVFEESEADGEAYTIAVADGKMTVRAPKGQWERLRRRIAHFFGDSVRTMPNAAIADAPSLGYRGLMIDIVRNYQTPAELRRILDVMAVYGLNTLHFHFSDDEAWRLEIKGLPELTGVASKRGYTPGHTNPMFLPQIYAGDGNPETKTGTANGFFTRRDYIDMVKYAHSLGITVLPEIESPGHSRAAIQAMKVRAKRTGDRSWLLRDDSDNTDFTSAQSFHDNVMNPTLEGPYKFIDAVAADLQAMHAEAGVPLEAIHIGGDEVAHGAFEKSPTVRALMDKEGFTSEKEVHAYFVNRVRQLLDARGLKLSGWQEIAHGHSAEYNKDVVPSTYGINCWSTLGRNKSVVDDIAAAGYPIILSNVEHFYLDMVYSFHPDERGLNWGGKTDEFDALAGYPSRLCTVPGANIAGIQGQIWAETIRSPQGLETMLLPKVAGLAERAWNPDSTYSKPAFNAAVVAELPKWGAAGYAYHVRQPGIRTAADGTFMVNTSIPGAVIRYTLDGSMPTEDSAVAVPGEPISAGDAAVVKAIQWAGGIPSAVTIATR